MFRFPLPDSSQASFRQYHQVGCDRDDSVCHSRGGIAALVLLWQVKMCHGFGKTGILQSWSHPCIPKRHPSVGLSFFVRIGA